MINAPPLTNSLRSFTSSSLANNSITSSQNWEMSAELKFNSIESFLLFSPSTSKKKKAFQFQIESKTHTKRKLNLQLYYFCWLMFFFNHHDKWFHFFFACDLMIVNGSLKFLFFTQPTPHWRKAEREKMESEKEKFHSFCCLHYYENSSLMRWRRKWWKKNQLADENLKENLFNFNSVESFSIVRLVFWIKLIQLRCYLTINYVEILTLQLSISSSLLL
jgi:hypothetical protein